MTFVKPMSSAEKRAAWSLAAVYALRMLGLFMILPVFALYADQLQGMTPFLLGCAIGIYGLTQALLQIPFGVLSDRLGRKPMIVLGLLIFAVGSFLAAGSEHIYGVIAGRALQGAGAIAAVIMALAADLSREQQRTKMMALIGMTIGAAFVAALILGPLLYAGLGVPGIFQLTGVLAVLAIVVIIYIVPTPPSRYSPAINQSGAAFWNILTDGRLLLLNLGVFVIHATITANFLVIPTILQDYLQIAAARHWLVYLGVLLSSLMIAMPVLWIADRLANRILLQRLAMVTLLVAGVGLAFSINNGVLFTAALIAFFIGFNILEASMPAELSKRVPATQKGAAMGVYSSSQFVGAFAGGVLAGALLGAYGIQIVLISGSLLALIWLIIASFIRHGSKAMTYESIAD